jgi:hypothetical protein
MQHNRESLLCHSNQDSALGLFMYIGHRFCLQKCSEICLRTDIILTFLHFITVIPRKLCLYKNALVFRISWTWSFGAETCRRFIRHVRFLILLCAFVGYCIYLYSDTFIWEYLNLNYQQSLPYAPHLIQDLMLQIRLKLFLFYSFPNIKFYTAIIFVNCNV